MLEQSVGEKKVCKGGDNSAREIIQENNGENDAKNTTSKVFEILGNLWKAIATCSSNNVKQLPLNEEPHEINTLTTYQMKRHRVPQRNIFFRDRKFGFWRMIQNNKKAVIYEKWYLGRH